MSYCIEFIFYFDYDYEALFCLSLSHRLKAYSDIFLVSPCFSVLYVKLRLNLIWILYVRVKGRENVG